MDFDLSDISLDLDKPAEADRRRERRRVDSRSDLGVVVRADEGGDDPLTRKLELAEEFRQIGDTEGARDLLQEVVAKANGALKTQGAEHARRPRLRLALCAARRSERCEVALGISYRGQAYHGWQSQPDGNTVQDRARARARAASPIEPSRTLCAGRTDAGVHALNQVVHLDTDAGASRIRGCAARNRFLPDDIALQWCRAVPDDVPCAQRAPGRRYAYVLLESPVRPSLEGGLVGWSFRAARWRRDARGGAAL